jgi:O-antigen/teichoic acid export membrane protein
MAESASRLSDASLALTQAMLLVSGAVACVVAAVNGAFVTWWVGPAQYAGFRVTALLVVAMLLRHLNVTTVYALFARGYEKQISLVTLADGAVTVAVTALAVHQLGVMGAPIGVIAGTCLVSLPLNLQRLARDAGSAPLALLRDLAPWATRFVLVLACAVVVALGWQPAGLRGAAMSGATIAAIYLALAGPLAFRHPLGMYVRPWLAWR